MIRPLFHYLTVNFYPLLINTSFQHSKVNNHISIKKHFYKILLFINFLFLETGGQHPSPLFFFACTILPKRKLRIYGRAFSIIYSIISFQNSISYFQKFCIGLSIRFPDFRDDGQMLDVRWHAERRLPRLTLAEWQST